MKKIIWILVVVVVVFLGMFLAVKSVALVKENGKLKGQLIQRQVNIKIVSFLDLFIQKVLKVDREVSFEDRLQLENSVREIGDSEILLVWEKFTGGTNEIQIQNSVKELLEVLVKKIVY